MNGAMGGRTPSGLTGLSAVHANYPSVGFLASIASALPMSHLGHLPTFRGTLGMSASPSEADIGAVFANVSFGPIPEVRPRIWFALSFKRQPIESSFLSNGRAEIAGNSHELLSEHKRT
jgi:hypothetical protein